MKHLFTIVLLVVLLSIVMAGYSYFVEPRWVVTSRVEVRLDDLPSEFDGLRVVQISDLHVGPYMSGEDIDKVVATVMDFQPDVVAITGDFISRPVDNIYSCARSLAALKADMGVYGILGNHDEDNQPDEITRVLRSNGIQVLRNQSVSITRGTARIWLLGVDDLYLDQDDLPTAMEAVPKSSTTILLCHNPDIAEEASLAGIDLVLAGHTHGGQVRLPFVSPLIGPVHNPEYLAGMYTIGHTKMYVNRGIGMVAPPIRFLAWPEVTFLTLRTGK